MIKFRDVYDAIKESQHFMIRIGQDIDNFGDEKNVHILAEEHTRLSERYMELYNMDVQLERVSLNDVEAKIKLCMGL
ncbi:hypothetical protein MHB54_05800 [Paenibacillus sp. FSL M7-0802]|uniref:hypothetical protein n=1 Tax=Paenibacillus TaxID=44249 RepID=UPI0003D363AF|nr:hypothetical protein [Paenibacillus polymyxa]AHC22717.1 hypothetical protein X809_07300 [Paenibacillus polymyxa CR1]